jgi:hypothetical protein
MEKMRRIFSNDHNTANNRTFDLAYRSVWSLMPAISARTMPPSIACARVNTPFQQGTDQHPDSGTGHCFSTHRFCQLLRWHTTVTPQFSAALPPLA